jgi:hypothetical protein
LREERGWGQEHLLILAGLGLAITGCFGRWVGHEAAGLALTGLELGEFAKSFPHVVRALIYLPFAAALVSLAVVAGELIHSRARLLAPPLCAAILLAAVFPYSFVTSAFGALQGSDPLELDPRYAGQAVVAATGTLLALLAPLAWRLGPRARGAILAVLSSAGVGLGLWQYATLYPCISAVYGRTPRLGWGVLACGLGLLTAAATGIRRAVRPGRPEQRSL